MTDCVDRKSLRDALYEADAITFKGLAIIDGFPTADVPDRKVGKWELAPIGFYFCSNCREAAINAERFCDEIWNFCPYCGARMLKDDPSHPYADDVMMGGEE